MRKTVGGFRFRDLPDWITYANYYCLKDLRYINIRMGEEYCPFCIDKKQFEEEKSFIKRKEYIKEHLDREEMKSYKEVQDITFEVGIEILKKIEKYVETHKNIPNCTNNELVLYVSETIIEALCKYFLRANEQYVPKEGLKYYFYEEYEKYLNFFDQEKHYVYVKERERISSFFSEHKENFRDFVVEKFNTQLLNEDLSVNEKVCEEILTHYIEQYSRQGKQAHIKKIEVRKLFGYHDYDFTMKDGDISIIIGTNGLGKTTIFNILSLLFSSREKHAFNKLFDLPFKSFKVELFNGGFLKLEKQNDEILTTSRREEGFTGDVPEPIKIKRDDKCGIDKFYERMKELFPEIYYKEKRFYFIKTKRLTENQLRGEFRKYFLDNRQTLTALDSEELIKEELLRKFNLWFSSLYYEKDPTKKSCFKDDNELKIKTSNNNILSIDKLSSGEINILTILFEIWFMTKPGAIVFIDEPEISLHIAWQQRLGEIIQEIVKIKKGVQVIMATHSPFVAAGNTDLLVEAELIGD